MMEKRIGKKRKHSEPLDNDDALLLCVKKKKEYNKPLTDYKENDTTRATLLKKKKHKKHKKKERKSRDTSPPPSQQQQQQQQQQPIKDDKIKTCSEKHRGNRKKYLRYRETFIKDLQQDIDHIDMGDTFEEKHKENVHNQHIDKDKSFGWKKGRWNVQENDVLQINLRQYKKMNGIEDIQKWILSEANRKTSLDLYKFLSKNINRSVFSVYRRLQRLFNDENYIGTWSEDMDKELLKLQGNHGNNWKLISEYLGVSPGLCQGHFRLISRSSHNGTWSCDEIDRLIQAIKSCGIDFTNGDIPVGMPWDRIADEVKTRSGLQFGVWDIIRVYLVSWKLQGGIEQWDNSDDVKLLEMLAIDMDAEDEEEVDWEGLVEEWESARNRYYVRQKWMTLKRLVPNYQFKTYQDCVDYLLEHQLPRLKKK